MRYFQASKILVEILFHSSVSGEKPRKAKETHHNDFQRISTPQIWHRCLFFGHTHHRHRSLTLSHFPTHREHRLQQLVRRQRCTKLRARSQDPCRAPLVKRLEPFFPPDSLSAMYQTTVVGLSLSSLNLQSCLDDVTRRGEVCGWHTGNCTCREEL